jgi:hypothetical protein
MTMAAMPPSGRHLLPQRVGAGHVGAQHAGGFVHLERQVVGVQPLWAVGDQGAQRVGAHERQQGGAVV